MATVAQDPFIVTLIDERDNALARNRDLERRVEAQEQDLLAASTVIMSLCDNAAERNDFAVQTIQRLSDECESLTNENDVLRTLIKNINEVYINMDEPGLMSWDERTRMRVEIVNDVNLLLAEMEK
jgi:hypothetical protein